MCWFRLITAKLRKKTSLWASYFGRFNKSQIRIVYAHETDKDQAARLKKNIDFFQKFLSSVNVSNQLVAGKNVELANL